MLQAPEPAASASLAFLQGLPTEQLLAGLAPTSQPSTSAQFSGTANSTLFGTELMGSFANPAVSPGTTPSLWSADLAASVTQQDPPSTLGAPFTDAGLFTDLSGSWGLSSPVFMPSTSAAGSAPLWQEGPVPEEGPALATGPSLKLAAGPSLNALGFVTRDSEGGGAGKAVPWAQAHAQPTELCPEYQRGFCRAGSKCLKKHGSVIASSGALPPMQGPGTVGPFGSALPFPSTALGGVFGEPGTGAAMDANALFGGASLLGQGQQSETLFGRQGKDAGEAWN